MTDRTEALKARLKARRSKLRETQGESDDDPSPRKPDATWDAAMNDDADNTLGGNTSIEMEEEVKESEKLVKSLKKTRKKRQKELDQTLREKEASDVSASTEMRRVKQETAKHVQEAAERSATEGEEEEAEAGPSKGKGKKKTPRTPKTPKSPKTPKGEEEIVKEEAAAATESAASAAPGSPLDGRSTEISKRVVDEEEKAKKAKTHGQTYKEKLALRLKQAKDKGKDAAYQAKSGRRLEGIRDKSLPTRFDDPNMMRKEDLEAEEQLQMSLSKREKFKEMASKATKQTRMSTIDGDQPRGQNYIPTAEEQFDFFSRQWEADPEQEKLDKEKAEKKKQPDKIEEQEEEGAKEGEGNEGADGEKAGEAEADAKDKKKDAKKKDVDEESQPLLDDDLDQEEDSWRFYQVGRAEYPGFREQINKEAEIYFMPSVVPAPVNDKIGTLAEVRYLEDEGFYVGEKPIMPNSAVHKMENRLLKENDKDWFGEDGKLIALPDPLKENPSRPFIPEEIEEPALETEYCKAFVNEFDSRFIDGSVEGHGQYRLDVDINTIVFTHHHLFSREHVLSARLTELYQQYVSRSKKNTAEYLHEKLKALKSAAAHVTANINQLKLDRRNKNTQALADQESRLKDYRYEIRQTRKQWHTELEADRNLLKHIIQTWKEIKSLRQFQGYTNTAAKLTIKKEPTDKATDERLWEEDIEDELEEVKHELEEEYERQMVEFSKQMEKFKEQKQGKKDAKARQKERRRKHKEGTPSGEVEDVDGANEEEEINKDQEILDEEDLPKPEKPVLGGDAEARDRILQLYDSIRRKPGEPKLYPELSSGASITPNNQCPRGEQSRRSDVNRHRVFVKVLFNGKEVSRTPAKSLGQDFVIRFAQIFNIEIVQWPESVKLQIYESSGIGSNLMTEVYTAIPDANITSETVQLDEVEFSGDQKVQHSNEGVGSGVPFSFEKDNSNVLSLMTSGVFSTSVAWGLDNNGIALVPPTGGRTDQFFSAMKGADAVAGIGMAGMQDMDKLAEWIAQSRLDPNDPSNAALMYLMRPGSGGGDGMLSFLRLPEHFRLEQLQEEFDLTTDEALDNSRRFRMIQLREKEIPEFKSKVIPIVDKEIPDETFIEYEKKLRAADKVKSAEDVDSHRVAVAKFMQTVREQVMMRFRMMAHQKVLSDIVFEDAVPNIAEPNNFVEFLFISQLIQYLQTRYGSDEPGTIIPNLMKFAEPRRPLKPTRKERKKVTAQNLQAMDVKVLVNVVRAFDIPVRSEALQPGNRTSRKETQRPAGGPSGMLGSTKVRNIAGETLVRPFIEVMFQRHTTATSVADGPNPSWNEELQIPFKAPNNDYTSANLQTVNDMLYLNLFDEYIIDVQQTDKERGASIHRRIEKRWLGAIKLPFSTIYFNSRIDGTFRINKPPVLLGYTHDTRNNKLDSGLEIGLGEGEHTYLTVFITIEPSLSAPEPAKEKFDSNEEEKLLIAAETWQADIEKKFPKREVKTTVVDINGKAVFMTRYFKPLKPPEVLMEDDAQKYEKVARYVSLIPFVSDSVVFPGMCDIWSTCDQFLQMLQGDEEEHAVLLVNYFQSMNKNSWLLMGSAIPEGPTAYVLTQESSDFWIWNASTGQHYSYRDNYCPVQSVGCLVNADNIWANIQPNDQPSRISFDIGNTSNWKPIFNKSFPHPGIASIQPENLLYFPTDQNHVYDLQEKIERQLKDKIMGWRPKYITRWNRYCVQSFRRLLAKLEENHGKGVQGQHASELEQVLGSYKLCGFPINLPYTEMEPIVEAVFATGVHNLESSEAEFALAVHIHPYPNSVLSVWVYVASLVKKR